MEPNETPQTPEEGTEEEVVLTTEQHKELVEGLANLTQDKTNLVNEIKELREKKQITEAEAEELRKKITDNQQPIDTGVLTPEKVKKTAEKTVSDILEQREKDSAKANRESAIRKFQELHKEFHPGNDEAGIKLGSLENTFNRFNVGSLKTEEEFLSVLDDAYKLLNPSKPLEEAPTEFQDEPVEGRGDPTPSGSDKNLTSKEQKLVRVYFKGSTEDYIKARAKRPDYVDQLLQFVR